MTYLPLRYRQPDVYRHLLCSVPNIRSFTCRANFVAWQVKKPANIVTYMKQRKNTTVTEPTSG